MLEQEEVARGMKNVHGKINMNENNNFQLNLVDEDVFSTLSYPEQRTIVNHKNLQ
jgi:hypothetical protein